MADLATLRQNLGVPFSSTSLLEQALVHSSYVNENPGFARTSNERLEFLGDAVLGLIVSEKLYQNFPRADEGRMTKLRATLVRQETLTQMAMSLNLGEYLYLGKGEEASGGRDKPANLAAALEAVIAAVFLDQGLSATRNFILRLLDTEMKKTSRDTRTDYKSELQELIQAREHQLPTYHIMEATGPDHNKRFTIEVRLGETVLGRGSGKNKKEAEMAAARSALEKFTTTFTP